MTMTISSKSLSFFPSPQTQTPLSTKPQTPNHIPLKPSFFSKPFLQINHTHQQSSISPLQSYPIQKKSNFSPILLSSNQESSISSNPIEKNPYFSPFLPPSCNQESSISTPSSSIQKNPTFSPTLSPKSLPIKKNPNFSPTLSPKSLAIQKNPNFSSPLCPKNPNFSSTLSPKPLLIEKDRNFTSTLSPESLSIAFPAFAYSNSLFFKSAYNVQVVGFDNEPEDRLIGRFRNAVMRAKVLQEARRRRFFETNQDKRKRKTRDALREAARRNRKRRDIPKDSKQGEKEQPKDEYNFRDDNWELTDVEVPYC